MGRLIVAAVAAVLASVVTASAQTDLTLNSLKTYSYDSMVSWHARDWRPAAVLEIADVEGMVFLDIRAVFDVPWTDELTRLSVSSGDIVLRLADGTEIESFGSYQYWGMMRLLPQSISLSRPRDFPEEDEDLYWHSLFLIPEGTTTATLVIPGTPGYEGEVSVPATGPEQDAPAFAAFEVSDVARFRQIALEEGRDFRRVTSTITAPAGYVLADLEVTVEGLAANEFAADGAFHWFTHSYRLVTPEGETLSLLGERFSRKLLGWQFNGIAIGQSTERRMILMVPEDLAGAVLLFGETPVAEVDLSVALADQG